MKGTGLRWHQRLGREEQVGPTPSSTPVPVNPLGFLRVFLRVVVAVAGRQGSRSGWSGGGNGRPPGEEQEERPAGLLGCRGRFCTVWSRRNPG